MILFGKRYQRRSYNAKAMNPTRNISQKINNDIPSVLKEYGQKIYEIRKRRGVSISATGLSGYGLWQYRHLPFKNTQLSIGTRSRICSVCPQCMHIDRPRSIESSFCFFLDVDLAWL